MSDLVRFHFKGPVQRVSRVLLDSGHVTLHLLNSLQILLHLSLHRAVLVYQD